MPEVALKLTPGVNAEYTPTLNESGISACNLIRFKQSLPQKLGGWQLYYPFALPGLTREIWAWEDLNNLNHLAAGTTTQLSVITSGALADITPQTVTSNIAPNFSTVINTTTITIIDANISNVTVFDSIFLATPVAIGGLVLQGTYPITVIGGATSYQIAAGTAAASTVNNAGAVPTLTTALNSAIVTVTIPVHGLAVGAFYTFQISTTVGGVVINGTYKVLTVPTANTFTIAASSLATSATTVSMNSGLARIVYYINLGPAAAGTGFGVGGFGVGGFGSGATPASQTGTAITATDWTMANWGEILLTNPDGGGIFQWEPNAGFQNAGLVSTAPIFNAGIFIAMPAQILVAYGSTVTAPDNGATSPEQDPMMVRWSDQEDYTNFSVSSLTQAGGRRISKGSRIVGGIQAPQQALIFTDLAVWAMSYLGPPLVFGFNELSAGCGLIGKHAVCVMRGVVFWMGTGSFFALSGGSVRNLPCSVWDVVFQDLDTTNQHKCRAAANSQFDEVWFFYPSASGGTGEVDKYVMYNIDENVWAYGTLGRSAWIDQSVLGQPIGVTPNGLIYQHEMGFDAAGQAMTPYFETGWFVIAEGQNMAVVDWFFPDMKWGYFGGSQGASVIITIYATDYPNGTVRTYGPFTVTQATAYVNTRLRGRQIKLRFASQDLGSFWRLGNQRARVAIDGRR